jgi:hypothetical protein
MAIRNPYLLLQTIQRSRMMVNAVVNEPEPEVNQPRDLEILSKQIADPLWPKYLRLGDIQEVPQLFPNQVCNSDKNGSNIVTV